MGRMYSVSFAAVAVTAQQDFFEINANTNRSLRVHSIFVGQSSDAGDAQDEQLAVLIKTGATTSGSGGSAPTPSPLIAGGAASNFTAEVNNTTKANTGTIVTAHADAFNVRGGWNYRPTPEERIELTGGGRLTVELATTPADSLTMSGTMIVEEIG
jgi:hypothetical protein